VQVQNSEWFCEMINLGSTDLWQGMVWYGVWIHLIWFSIYLEIDVSCMGHTAFKLQSECKCIN